MVHHLLGWAAASSPSPLHIPLPSFSIKKDIFSFGFRVWGHNHEFMGLHQRNKNGTALNCGVDKDSEYEIDPDKAREALRRLDEQLQSLSKKQTNPPKIRAVDIKQSIPSGETQEESAAEEVPGSFLASAAAALLLFTIFYNILFLTVIKPSIDGAPPLPSADVIQETQQGDTLGRNFDIPLGP